MHKVEFVSEKPTYTIYLTPLMRSVTSSVVGKMMPVIMSRTILPQPVTFGGNVGSEISGHLEILTIKQKEMSKGDLDVKNWISNYLEQQEVHFGDTSGSDNDGHLEILQ